MLISRPRLDSAKKEMTVRNGLPQVGQIQAQGSFTEDVYCGSVSKSGMLSELGYRSCLGKENRKQNLVASPVPKAFLLLKGASWVGEKGAPGYGF